MFEQISLVIILNSVLLGVGLAMDAFSVSIVNGLNEPEMKPARMSIIAGCYALFQFAMPMIGWFLVHSLIGVFKGIEPFIPWIALILLILIGGKMIVESLRDIRESKKAKMAKMAKKGTKSMSEKAQVTPQPQMTSQPQENELSEAEEESEIIKTAKGKVTFAVLLLQGVATSIDALSVGLTIAEYNAVTALLSALIIAAVTFLICMVGLKIGKLVGNKLGVYAGILGGTILIGIGTEIFIKGIFFG